MDINQKLAQAYLAMYETKAKREAWVPESITDEDVADFMGAAAAAAKAGKKEFKFGDKTYKVTMKKSTVDAISEKDEACPDCGKVHEGSCGKKRMKEEADLEEKYSPSMGYKNAQKAIDTLLGALNPTGVLAKGISKGADNVVPEFKKMYKHIAQIEALWDDVAMIIDMSEEVELEEVTKDSDKLEPRAKGEKDFKKMHDDNIEIKDEEEDDKENFDNIKKSADSIKK